MKIMTDKNFKEIIFNPVNLSDENKEKFLFEQYKLYIKSAEKISDRRQKSNEFFLTLNTAILATIGFAISKGKNIMPSLFFILIGIGGITICYFWYRIIRSYKGLNSGKFDVIHIIETKLPLSLHKAEWEILGKGISKDKYWPFSHVELNVPWVFIIFYSFVLLKFLIPILIILYPILMK